MSYKDRQKQRDYDREWHRQARRGVYGLHEYLRRRRRDLLTQREQVREELRQLGGQ